MRKLSSSSCRQSSSSLDLVFAEAKPLTAVLQYDSPFVTLIALNSCAVRKKGVHVAIGRAAHIHSVWLGHGVTSPYYENSWLPAADLLLIMLLVRN